MSINNSYSVILPTLNEVGHIKSLVLDISRNFNKLNLIYEIIIVDDSSTDGTIEAVSAINNSNLIIHKRFKKKKSLVDSLNEGIKLSKYENIIWMDADYSHPPEYITEFIKKNNNTNNIDAIVCSRFLKKSKRYYENTKLRPVGIDYLSIFLNKICRLVLFDDFTDYTSGYICIKKNIIKNIKLKGYYGDYFITLITRCKVSGNSILEIPFTEKERASGQSKTTTNKLNFIIKCYFYLYQLLKSLLIKLKFFKL